nr:hypothetical protein [Candidatus Sigynarchaeum springense]MDO8117856.1 hypothetical protein [Candidatus Sigynarchaeota archaeon]
MGEEKKYEDDDLPPEDPELDDDYFERKAYEEYGEVRKEKKETEIMWSKRSPQMKAVCPHCNQELDPKSQVFVVAGPLFEVQFLIGTSKRIFLVTCGKCNKVLGTIYPYQYSYRR